MKAAQKSIIQNLPLREVALTRVRTTIYRRRVRSMAFLIFRILRLIPIKCSSISTSTTTNSWTQNFKWELNSLNPVSTRCQKGSRYWRSRRMSIWGRTFSSIRILGAYFWRIIKKPWDRKPSNVSMNWIRKQLENLVKYHHSVRQSNNENSSKTTTNRNQESKLPSTVKTTKSKTSQASNLSRHRWTNKASMNFSDNRTN